MTDTSLTTAPPAPTARTPRVARRRRRGSPTVRWTLRLVAVGYVLGLVALPVLTVGRRTFGNGLQPVFDALQNPDLISAARLSVIVAVISV
ncbi:MAG TPA: hypothetical protein VHN80_32465, partial [Kineosporiaceae bacterium]|nr:hypothetical protein [Kineosporiaceae bacterium]